MSRGGSQTARGLREWRGVPGPLLDTSGSGTLVGLSENSRSWRALWVVMLVCCSAPAKPVLPSPTPAISTTTQAGASSASAGQSQPPLVGGPAAIAQTWTRRGFRSIVFTPDGKELIASELEGIYAFDVNSGRLRARLGAAERTSRLVASNSTIYLRGGNTIQAFDRVTGERAAIDGAHPGELVGRTSAGEIVVRRPEELASYSATPFKQLRAATVPQGDYGEPEAMSPDGSVIATGGENGIARLWTTATLTERPAVRCAVSRISRIALSSNGAWIACATARGSIVLTEIAKSSSSIVHLDPFRVLGAEEMAFHPTLPLLAVASSNGGFLYNMSTRAQVRFDVEPRQYMAVAWSPDGSTLAMTTAEGVIELLDSNGSPLRTLSPTQVGKVDGIGRASPGVLVLHESSRLRTWDGATGHEQLLSGRASAFAWNPDGTARVVHDWSGIMVTTRAGSTSLKMEHVSSVAIASDAKRFFVATDERRTEERVDVAGHDVATLKQLWTQRFDASLKRLTTSPRSGDLGFILTNDPKTAGTIGRYQAVAMSSDGRTLGTYSPAGVSFVNDIIPLDDRRWLLSEGNLVSRWDTRSSETEKTAIAAVSLAISLDGKRVAATNPHDVYIVDPGTLVVQAHARFPGAKIEESVFVTDDVIATRIEDGTVVVWRMHGGALERVGMLIATARRGTVLVSPLGYYMAEAEAASALGFTLGSEVFRFEQFDSTLNRPHLALGALGIASSATLALYEAAYDKRQKQRALQVTAANRLQVPSVDFVGQLPLRATTDKVLVKLRADGRGSVIARLNVRVNGVPLLGRSGLDVRSKRQAVVELAHDVPLEVGENRIEVEAENEEGVLALGRTVIVTRDGAVKPGALHVISIGVSKYAEGNDLEYAAKDAQDVATALTNAATYKGVVTKTVLQNEQVTRATVLALRAQLMRTAIDDIVVVFVAGHGLIDADDQYVFGTHDISFATGAKGIRFGELEGLLDGIPARRKILMLDTCHAGELDLEELAHVQQSELAGKRGVRRIKGMPAPRSAGDPRARAVAARALFTELRRGAGVTVIAASAGAEYSYEDGAVKNGLFSHAFIEGMKGDADANRDGAVRVTELIEYVTAKVAEQSRGFQVPQARELNRDLDFDLTPGHPRSQPWRYEGCAVKQDIGTNAQGRTTITTPTANMLYECGSLLAGSEMSQQLTPEKELDQLASKFAKILGPTAQVSWTTKHFLVGVKHARKVRVTEPGYPLDVVVAWIAVDPTTKRVGMCLAFDGLSVAVDRCRKAMPLLLQASPPQELP